MATEFAARLDNDATMLPTPPARKNEFAHKASTPGNCTSLETWLLNLATMPKSHPEEYTRAQPMPLGF